MVFGRRKAKGFQAVSLENLSPKFLEKYWTKKRKIMLKQVPSTTCMILIIVHTFSNYSL